MKKRVLTNLLFSVGVLGVIIPTQAFAAEEEAAVQQPVTAKTETEVGFSAGDRPDPSLPQEGPASPTPVDPDTDPTTNEPKPLPEANNVFVTHLPNISFGTNKTNPATVEYSAITEKRTKNGGAETLYMPHSVQVADLSGSGQTKWKLSVHQDAIFKTSDATNPLKLENSRIRIYGNTVTSTAYTAAALTDKVTGVNLSQTDEFGTYASIPVASVDSADELVVLESKTAGFTLNSYTSSVFSADYAEDSNTADESRYEGIRLNVPSSDQAQAKPYAAKLTWSLTVEP